MKYGRSEVEQKKIKNKKKSSLLDVRRIVSGSKGVCEIINEAMKNIMRARGVFSKVRQEKGRRELASGEERRRLTQAASGKCLAFVVG